MEYSNSCIQLKIIIMKKLFLGLFALGMFHVSHAQTKGKATFKPPVIKKDKANVLYENETNLTPEPPPPPPPPPPVVAAPPPPPPPPPSPKRQKTTFTAPVIVKDGKE